jgi:UDP-2,4-diacetamido-2,4,6-trideoxy-beta-L-altropyranose hydrolase
MGTDSMAIALRADAGPAIGIGHAMRCLAVGQAFRDRSARVVFVTREGAPGVEAKMRAEGIEIVRAAAATGDDSEADLARIAPEIGAAWSVIDGASVSARVVDALRAKRCRVAMIDDDGIACGARPDVIINQNSHAAVSLYEECAGKTRLLLGPAYALLRREFRERLGWSREVPAVGRNVLVTLGGSDPDNATRLVLSAVEQVELEPLEVVVVVGASSPHATAIAEQAAKSRARVRVERDVTRMAELMAWADVAVSSGGSTVWELAFMGLPSLVGSIAADQRALVGSSPFFESLGPFVSVRPELLAGALRSLLLDRTRRLDQSVRARTLVDGRGCDRVLDVLSETDALRSAPKCGSERLREVRDEWE